jgi:hypothetical protein
MGLDGTRKGLREPQSKPLYETPCSVACGTRTGSLLPERNRSATT